MMVWKLNFNQKGESEKMIKILFVCHGNICRSVAAEYIFKAIVKEKIKNRYFKFLLGLLRRKKREMIFIHR